MLDRAAIARLIPHKGAMCLLDSVACWSEDRIRCLASSHLDRTNPLRRQGRLSAVAGIEYGLQAVALHGALRSARAQAPGWLAVLRAVNVDTDYLDDPSIGTLVAQARMTHGDAAGILYDFSLEAEDGRRLLEGQATIALARRTG